jgi:hypothetical protein
MTVISVWPTQPLTNASPSASAWPKSRIIFAAVEHTSTGATNRDGTLREYVVAQAASEPAADFARRVGFELVRLRDRGIPDRGVAVLSLAAGLSSKQIEARCAICTALLRCFAQSEVVVVLVCDVRASRDERAHALALAEGLCEGRVGRRVLVRFSNVAGSELRGESTC